MFNCTTLFYKPPNSAIYFHFNHRSSCCGSKEPVYQAIWADNSDFQEVLVSPTMVNDHMPDNVMEALEKVGIVFNSIGMKFYFLVFIDM